MDCNTINFTKCCSNTKYLFAFLLGLSSTMPIVGIVIGNRDISLFKILFFLAIVYSSLCAINSKILIGKATQRLLSWLIEALFACFFGYILLFSSLPDWASAAYSYIPKVLLLVLFSVFWNSQPNLHDVNNIVIKGFLYGCLINCLWASFDAAGYYLFKKSINNIVFSDYIVRNHVRYDSLSLILNNGMIRASGFNGDPAHLGFLAPVIVGYSFRKRNIWMFVISIVAILSSASTTAIVSSIFVVITSLFIKVKHDITRRKVVISLVLFSVFFIFFFFYFERIFLLTHSVAKTIIDRISNVYLNNTKPDIRIDYLRFFPKALSNVYLFILFGTGFGTSSLGYVIDSSILERFGTDYYFPYDMENTYIAYFLDTGIIGFLLFLSVLVFLIKNIRKLILSKQCFDHESDTLIILWVSLCSTGISMLFYHYILFGPQMLVLAIAVSYVDCKNYNAL